VVARAVDFLESGTDTPFFEGRVEEGEMGALSAEELAYGAADAAWSGSERW
jgi:hypothetical protein